MEIKKKKKELINLVKIHSLLNMHPLCSEKIKYFHQQKMSENNDSGKS